MSKVFFCRKVCFTAVHYYQLANVTPEENKCLFGDASQPHEHDWQLTVWLDGEPNAKTGLIVDLMAVDKVLKEEVLEPFHNTHINDVDPYFQKHLPATEILASYFAEKLAPLFAPARLHKLRVAEADDLFSEWHA